MLYNNISNEKLEVIKTKIKNDITTYLSNRECQPKSGQFH